MITSKQIINLSEDWFKRIHFDIFINPTSSDYQELTKLKVNEVRFIADDRSKKLFISDSGKSLHHQMVVDIGGSVLENYNSREYPQLHGVARISGSKAFMTESDVLRIGIKEMMPFQQNWLRKLLSCNWSWADRYLEITSYLTNFKTQNKNQLIILSI